MKNFDLSGRVAIVTGGNGGIGLGIARGLAEAGAAIIVAGRDPAKSSRAVKELEAKGARAKAIAVDMTDERSCRQMVDEAAGAFGRLDILVNNAGMSIRKPPQDFTLAEWNTVIGSNLTGAFICSQAAYPHFRKAGAGKIINVASIMSNLALPFAVAYAASKGGMVQMTRGLAVAWASDRIQANAILPGWIDTEMTMAARKMVAGFEEKMLARCPAGRWGQPDDLAGVAVFLASPASDFVTGSTYTVDGGYSAKG